MSKRKANTKDSEINLRDALKRRNLVAVDKSILESIIDEARSFAACPEADAGELCQCRGCVFVYEIATRLGFEPEVVYTLDPEVVFVTEQASLRSLNDDVD